MEIHRDAIYVLYFGTVFWLVQAEVKSDEGRSRRFNGRVHCRTAPGVAVNAVLAGRSRASRRLRIRPSVCPDGSDELSKPPERASLHHVGLPADDGVEPGHRLRRPHPEGLTVVATDTVDGATFTDTPTGLIDGTSYSVTVAAVNAAGEKALSEPAVLSRRTLSKPRTWSQPRMRRLRRELGGDAAQRRRRAHQRLRRLGEDGAPGPVATDRVDPTQLDRAATNDGGHGHRAPRSTRSASETVRPVDRHSGARLSQPGPPIDAVFRLAAGGGAQVRPGTGCPPHAGRRARRRATSVRICQSGQLVRRLRPRRRNNHTDAISGLVDEISYDVTVAAVNALGVGRSRARSSSCPNARRRRRRCRST